MKLSSIDMVKDFIIADSLHLLDLGVFKRLLQGWRTGSLCKRAKWSHQQKKEISEYLVKVRFPREINRRMRSMDFISLWKGLEYRHFLLYVGVVILKRFLPEKFYDHYLLLFCATTICSAKKYECYFDIAEELYVHFVKKYKTIVYGLHFITSNVHNLIHIVDDVKRFGILPTISAYPFFESPL